MTRQQLITLYRKSHDAWEKARRNQGKMDFMSFSNNGIDPYGCEQWRDQLDSMFAEANKATAEFTAAVANMSAVEIVSIVSAA